MLIGLNMDITYPVIHCLDQDTVHQFDDRGIGGLKLIAGFFRLCR